MATRTRHDKLNGSCAVKSPSRACGKRAYMPRRHRVAGSALGLIFSIGTICVAKAQPVTGLYINGEGGATFNQDQVNRSSPSFPVGRDKYDVGAAGLGSVGWGFGNGFRVEVEGNYRDSNLGYYRSNHGSPVASGGQKVYGAMANALFDMDLGKNWIFPNFGAGIGYAWQRSDFNIAIPSLGYNQHVGGTFGNFAYQAIFGLAFPVPHAPGLSLTTEYRFMTMLGPQSHHGRANGVLTDAGYTPGAVAAGNRSTTTYFNHSAMLGLRYEFNPPPPPAPHVDTPVQAPGPAPARTYLVFFDWDKADLSNRARAVIEAAAQNASHVGETRIKVNGYTDNSAGHPGARGKAYNMQLSLRRARAVKSELIRDGVAEGTIETRGFGDADPLVRTKLNTREPQNRRVAIILD